MLVSITSLSLDEVAIAKTALTDKLLHEIGGIFTSKGEDDTAFGLYLYSIFEKRNFKWYCIDHTDGAISRLTFSNASNPRLLSFRGANVRIAPADADSFELLVQQCDAVKPSGKRQENKTYIG